MKYRRGIIMRNKQRILTRRDFVRRTVGVAIGTSILGTEWNIESRSPARSSQVAVVRDKNVMDADLNVDEGLLKSMLERTLATVTGKENSVEAWLSLVSPDDTIGLVPTPALNPTHDELIDVVTNSLMEAGIPEANIIMAQGGIALPRACTALICMPALKAHWLTGIGTVIKNYIRYSRNPRGYHDENSAKLGEIWNLPDVSGKTKLILVDALHPLCDKGPQPDPRYKWPYNGLIGGTDPVAVEAVGLRIITEKRTALRGEPWPLSPPPLCVEAADRAYGLGVSNWDEIQVTPVGWEEALLL